MNTFTTNIPVELRNLERWLIASVQYSAKEKKYKKVPCSAQTGWAISPVNPASWRSFDVACDALSKHKDSALGYALNAADNITILDYDHCIVDGALDPWVKAQIDRFKSYTELSQSGTGIHIICYGKTPIDIGVKPKTIDGHQFEMYNDKHFFVLTGNIYQGYKEMKDCSAQLAELASECVAKSSSAGSKEQSSGEEIFTDEELIEKASRAANGDKFKRLMAGDISEHGNDHSSADQALCNILSFYSRSEEQIERIFNQSGLVRNKWTGRADYRHDTIMNALAQTSNSHYNPEEYKKQQALSDFSEPVKTKAPALQFITASDLAAKKLDPIIYYVEGMLPQGLSLLCAPPKYGKSWFVLDLCLSITRGTAFLERKTKKAACVYLALEDSENRLQSRMNTLLDGAAAPDNLIISIKAGTLDDGLMQQLESTVEAFPDIGVIVIDTLQKVRGTAGKTEGAYKYDYREMSILKAFADKYRIAVLLVHHLRKMTDDSDPHNRISGTNGIMGAADTSMVITKDKRSNEDSMLSITGRDVDMDDIAIKFDKDSCRWQLLEAKDRAKEAKRKYEKNPLVRLLRELLKDTGRWQGTMSELIIVSRDYPGCEIYEQPRKVTSMLQSLEPDLGRYDDITYYRLPHGKSGGSAYVFEDAWLLNNGSEEITSITPVGA